jgi:hypothetical protein
MGLHQSSPGLLGKEKAVPFYWGRLFACPPKTLVND